MKKMDLRSRKQNPQNMNDVVAGMDPNTVKQVQRAISQYEGKDEDQLMAQLFEAASRERAAGNLDNAKLDMIANSVGGMLSPNQRARMMETLQQLKQQ